MIRPWGHEELDMTKQQQSNVVCVLGSLDMFCRLFFVTFCQSLWLASSEDRSSTLCSGAVCLGVEYL